jgi:predicted AAA+ superfamily ATPase
LLVFKEGKKIGFEFKYSDSQKITKSMHIAIEDLKLDELNIIIPASIRFKIADNITVSGLEAFLGC